MPMEMLVISPQYLTAPLRSRVMAVDEVRLIAMSPEAAVAAGNTLSVLMVSEPPLGMAVAQLLGRKVHRYLVEAPKAVPELTAREQNLAAVVVAVVPLVNLRKVAVLSMEPEVAVLVEATVAPSTAMKAVHGEVMQSAVEEMEETQ